MTRKILTPFVVFLISSLLSIGVAQDGDAGYQGLKFSAQPKHQSELGVSLGHFMVVGDITPRPGWGVGVHFRDRSRWEAIQAFLLQRFTTGSEA